MNTAVAAKEQPVQEVACRRFQLPDLDRHGAWLFDRLLKIFPHRTPQDLRGWLRQIMYSNDFLFLYQDHGCALATVLYTNPLIPQGQVYEIFVLSEEGHQSEAVTFYDEFERWARTRGIDVMVVEENSDVPHELIAKRMGRVFEKTTRFAKVRSKGA